MAIAASLTVTPTTSQVYVDGKLVPVDAYTIDGSNYFKLRDFCSAVDIGVWYETSTRNIYIETDKGYDPDYTGSGTASQTTPTPQPTPQPTLQPTPKPTPTPSTGSETVSQKNAVQKAKIYIEYGAFSRDGLIAQLEYEKFSNADAVYGADNCGADWFEQAAKKAQIYVDTIAPSREGLINQLIFEKFTREQAEYGADAVGL